MAITLNGDRWHEQHWIWRFMYWTVCSVRQIDNILSLSTSTGIWKRGLCGQTRTIRCRWAFCDVFAPSTNVYFLTYLNFLLLTAKDQVRKPCLRRNLSSSAAVGGQCAHLPAPAGHSSVSERVTWVWAIMQRDGIDGIWRKDSLYVTCGDVSDTAENLDYKTIIGCRINEWSDSKCRSASTNF